MIGRILSHYRILEQIGAGGMGVVYRAHDERLDRDVAVKVLSPELADDKDFVARFRREARTLSKLNHPNIATVHDFDTDHGTSFLVMELIQGTSLASKSRRGPLQEKEIVHLGLQLLQGLGAAHAEGIIHRDLKPSNLCETLDGRLKILDFGLARSLQSDSDATQSLARSTGVVGTLPYMAPEQLRGESVDVRTDIYSVGVVLYELATGQLPFAESFAPRLIDSILHHNPLHPRELNSQLSPWIQRIILRALEREPENRYRTATEMGTALGQTQDGIQGSPTEAAVLLQAPPMEIAHVLFTDIVGYSKLAMDEQQRQLQQLQKLVRATSEFERAKAEGQLVSLPTGDGMALVFFGEPEAAARCAVKLNKSLRAHPEIKLRMGVNSGPVYRLADINANRNVAGGGINIAQRVMDCGDAGHILVSKAVADILGQLSAWSGLLHDLGEMEVKHGLRVHIYNLVDDCTGNPATPSKSRAPAMPEKDLRAGTSRKLQLLGVSAVIAAVILVVTVLRAPVAHARRPKIAVLGFKNLNPTPQNSWVSESLGSMLSAELTAGDHVVTVPGETVTQASAELGLPQADSYGPETLARVRKRLDCDYVVYGSFWDTGKDAGGHLQVQFHMQKTDSGETVVGAPQAGNEIAIDELASTIGATLRGKLGLPGISSTESSEIQAAIPSTPEARTFYAQGLTQIRTLDLLSARTSFEKAIAADPNFSLAHAQLAEVWKGLGYDEKARAEAKAAFDLSSHLGNEDRTIVEARYREMASEWDKAVDLYRSLWIVGRKQTPEYAYRAADVQIRAGKAADALQTVAELRAQPGEIASSPLIDLREAEAYESLGDVQKEAASARQAAEKAQVIGARLVESESLWRVCGAEARLGNAAIASTACERSLEIAKRTEDHLLVARALTNLGNIASGQGNFAKALDLHRQALQIAQSLGSQRDTIGALANIGDALSNQGNHAGAQKSYQAAMGAARDINDQSLMLKLDNDLAAESEATGDFGVALEHFQHSLAAAEATRDKVGALDAKTNIGSLEAMLGNLSGGLKNLKEALQESDEAGLKDKTTQILFMVGDILVSQGELQSAEAVYLRAQELAGQLGDANLKATAQLALGNLALEKGNASVAQALAKEAAAAFHAAPNTDMECSALLVVVSALIEQKRYTEAETALNEALALKPQDAETRLSANLASGRLLARQGRFALARNEISQVSRGARKIGLREMGYRATLADGEVRILEGDKARAKIRLQQLEKEARANGYHGVEKSAKALEAGVA